MAKKTTTQQGEAATEKARKTRKAAEPKTAPEPEVEQAEIIEDDDSQRLAEAELITNKAISKFNLTDAKLAELKEKYQDLTITDYDDKAQKEAVKLAKREVGDLVSGLEKKRVSLKEPFLNAGRLIDAEAKRIAAKLAEVYEPIVDLAKSVKEHEEAEKKRKQEEAEQKLKERVDRLVEAGLKFDGAFYSIGDNISMDITTIKNLKDFDFDALEAKVILEKERLDKLAEEERQRKEEEEKERKERERKIKEEEEKQEEECKRLQKERDEFEKEKEEMRRYKEEQLVSKRGWELEKLGLKHIKEIGAYVYGDGVMKVTHKQILEYTDEEYSEKLLDVQQGIAEIEEEAKAAQEEKERLELAKVRLTKLTVLNFGIVGEVVRHLHIKDGLIIQPEFLGTASDEDFTKVFVQASEENDEHLEAVEREAEKARQEKMDDKQKLVEFYDKFEKFLDKSPKMTDAEASEKLSKAISNFNREIAGILQYFNS